MGNDKVITCNGHKLTIKDDTSAGKANIWFLRQLVEQEQREVGEVLDYNHDTPFANKNLLESARAKQKACADALKFLKSLEVDK